MSPPFVATAEGTAVARSLQPRTIERVPTEAPPHRERHLYDLTDEALARGFSDLELANNRGIGNCKAQVEVRIQQLNRWLETHPATT